MKLIFYLLFIHIFFFNTSIGMDKKKLNQLFLDFKNEMIEKEKKSNNLFPIQNLLDESDKLFIQYNKTPSVNVEMRMMVIAKSIDNFHTGYKPQLPPTFNEEISKEIDKQIRYYRLTMSEEDFRKLENIDHYIKLYIKMSANDYDKMRKNLQIEEKKINSTTVPQTTILEYSKKIRANKATEEIVARIIKRAFGENNPRPWVDSIVEYSDQYEKLNIEDLEREYNSLSVSLENAKKSSTTQKNKITPQAIQEEERKLEAISYLAAKKQKNIGAITTKKKCMVIEEAPSFFGKELLDTDVYIKYIDEQAKIVAHKKFGSYKKNQPSPFLAAVNEDGKVVIYDQRSRALAICSLEPINNTIVIKPYPADKFSVKLSKRVAQQLFFTHEKIILVYDDQIHMITIHNDRTIQEKALFYANVEPAARKESTNYLNTIQATALQDKNKLWIVLNKDTYPNKSSLVKHSIQSIIIDKE